MPHIVLLGDSVFDNAAYVRGGPDVVQQLRGRLDPGWEATLLAVDGHVTRNVAGQLARLPGDATHLVVSVGGNDALGSAGVLSRGARTVGEAMDRLHDDVAPFALRYRAMLDDVLLRGLPAAVCTIYDGRLPDPDHRRRAGMALSAFNDAILRTAFGLGVPVIDLRLVCGEDADYANPIEPSERGGDKIAAAIVRLLREHDFARRRTEVYA